MAKRNKKSTKKKAASRGEAADTGFTGSGSRAPRRAFPRATIEEALKIPQVLKDKNGGNPWSPDEIANALGLSKTTTKFFYIAAAARDFGLTEGGRDSAQILLTELGRDLVYAPSKDVEAQLKRKAFQNVDLFVRVLDYYKGSRLPEMKYLGNTLEREFGIDRNDHEEFSELFKRNCEYLGIGEGYGRDSRSPGVPEAGDSERVSVRDTVTLAEPEDETGLKCFVIMPFRERTDRHPAGFFDEVLRSLIAPAGRKAGFTVETANRQGTEVIHSRIINDLLDADLVVADLTEHNPNVLFELGMRMAHDKPVALIRARGTGPVFDVDNMLRVLDYDPNLWASTIERDLPKVKEHIEATWKSRDKQETYLKILRRTPMGGGD